MNSSTSSSSPVCLAYLFACSLWPSRHLAHSHILILSSSFCCRSMTRCMLLAALLCSVTLLCSLFCCFLLLVLVPSAARHLFHSDALQRCSLALLLVPFIYCLSMSLFICIVYFRWLMPPCRSDLSFSLLPLARLSIIMFSSFLFCFLFFSHAKCIANSSER